MEASQPHHGSPYSSRMSEHPIYFLSDHFIESLEIQGIRCYFQPFKETETFEAIQQQMTRISDKPIPLDQSNVIIDKDMPLSKLITSQKDLKVFQKVLNTIAAKKTVDLQEFGENKQIITKIIHNIDKHNQIKGIKSEEAKKTVDLQEFGENKQIITKIIHNIDKHNQIKGIKSEEIQLFLKGREQFTSKVIYRTTSGTRLKTILKYLDDKAGRVLPPIRVSDNQKAYDLSQEGLSLQVKAKTLFLQYSPPLTFLQQQQFLIHLTQCAFEQNLLRVLVEPKATLLQIIELASAMLKEGSKPALIKDFFGNILDLKKWECNISQLYLRKCWLQFSYKPASVQCQIQIVCLPDEPIKTTYLLKRNTTLHQILQHVRKVAGNPPGDFELSDIQGRKLPEEVANQPLQKINLLDLHHLTAVYHRPKGYLRGNTFLLSQKGQNSIQQLSVKRIHYFQVNQGDLRINIATYNEDKHQIQKSYISCFKKETKKVKLLLIEVSVNHPYKSTFKIQCTEDTVFLTGELLWKSAGLLKSGQRLMMVSENSREITSRCITQIQSIQLQAQEELYSFEVEGNHTFIANHFILHNEDAIALTAYIFSKNKPMIKKKVSCYLHNKINDVPQFNGKRVLIGGGLVLSNQLTFGDYSINDFKTVSVFDGASKESSMLIISEWRNQSYVINQQQPTKIQQLKNKWISQYLALNNYQIVEVNNNLSTIQQPSKLSHVLVGPKIIFSKLYYLSNIQPRYSNKEQKFYQQFKTKWPMNSIIQKGTLSEKDIYPIYLYTTNYMYTQLNRFLRSKDKSTYGPTMAEQWYAATNLIYRSLEKIPFFQKEVEVYRGMAKVCLDKAFCLTQKDKPFCISKTKENESYMVIESFTSCSTNINVAKGFAGTKGALLTFRGNFRQSISAYSQYAHENQVLLPPYLYFMITAYDTTQHIQTMTLQEIPFPCTLNNKLIYWVDDIPSNNTGLVRQFENAGIEVVQVTTTRIMKVILRDFFSILHALGKKIVIISDMARQEEGGVWNYQAGVELFNLIYNQYGMSNKAIIFTGNRQKALQTIKERGVNKGNWEVFTGCQEVRSAVLRQFE